MKVRPLLVAAVLCLAGLAGCTTNHDLPTISNAPSTPTVDLEAVAKSYYDCMTDAGIEMNISANSQGALTNVTFGGDHAVEWQSPDGGAGVSLPSNAPAGPVTHDYNQQGAYLTIDGMDHTEVYLQCLSASGYSDSATIVPVFFDPEQIEHALTITNTWASCARENGFPDVRDAIALPDNSGLTHLHLPSSITEDQLRQLLAVCPNFDPDQPGAGTPSTESSAGFLLPQMLFDSPSEAPIDSTSDPEAQLAADHVDKLYSIWYEAIETYYENH